jgi:dipeptidyl aminopeptidase/acylaminoacyl peptidase
MKIDRSSASSFMVAFLCLHCATGAIVLGQQLKRAFTVKDDIELVRFDDSTPIQFSPDGNYLAVFASQGLLDLNRVENSLRLYRVEEVQEFLSHFDKSEPPSPVWIVKRYGMTGPIINHWCWLPDSTGLAFLEPTANGKRLFVADLRNRTIDPLTSATEAVELFDIRDRSHYVYTVDDAAGQKEWKAKFQKPTIVGTGRDIWELLFPDAPVTALFVSPRRHLWAVEPTKRFEVKVGGASLGLVDSSGLALSPNGKSVVTALPVVEVPSSWERLYPPAPDNLSPLARIHTGHQDLSFNPNSVWPVQQYVRIDLERGVVQSLTDAPLSRDAGWRGSGGSLSWSGDGQAVLLPHTFLRSKDQAPSRPCVAVVDLLSDNRTCVETLKSRTSGSGSERGYHSIDEVRFVNGEKRRVVVMFRDEQGRPGSIEYQYAATGSWEPVLENRGDPSRERSGLEITVKQGLNNPPQLVAANKKTSQVLWDPNPQLESIDLGKVSVYKWRDQDGGERTGALYKPEGYRLGRRYPLVIQTYGLTTSEFLPSGTLSTAFAAKALAAAGIMVLQIAEHCPYSSPEEGECAMSAYEAASRQLVSEGFVDPERIGIIGFSRTCFYVMETLTMSSLHVKAASVTDGVTADYFQYMQGERLTRNFDAMIGAPPFGDGLQQWFKRSPGFNLDKVNTPLIVVAEGPGSVLFMWQTYAALHYLHKPVDLVMLNTQEHILTNPAVRMASQGGTVDWFRFWLQGYENPDPALADQYARWRQMRKVQETDQKK